MSRNRGLNFYKKKKKINQSLLKETISWIFLIVMALVMAFLFVYAVGMKTSVIGDAMQPTLYNGQEVLISRIGYMLSSPKRGDVIVFWPNGNQNTHYYVKRVVGLPRETLQIIDGRVYIDGVIYDESDSFDLMEDAGIAENKIVLGDDEYFVLGDNRNSSEDSRSANVGTVTKDTIIGKAWYHLESQKEGFGFIK